MKETKIDITHIPFSRYGAYVSVTREEGKDGEKEWVKFDDAVGRICGENLKSK